MAIGSDGITVGVHWVIKEQENLEKPYFVGVGRVFAERIKAETYLLNGCAVTDQNLGNDRIIQAFGTLTNVGILIQIQRQTKALA